MRYFKVSITLVINTEKSATNNSIELCVLYFFELLVSLKKNIEK
jgi:hypothetical protein